MVSPGLDLESSFSQALEGLGLSADVAEAHRERPTGHHKPKGDEPWGGSPEAPQAAGLRQPWLLAVLPLHVKESPRGHL